MIILRHFDFNDSAILKKYEYPNMSENEIREIIAEWNKMSHNGRYFESFAAVENGEVIGSFFVVEHENRRISIGPEVFSPFRKKGYAYIAMKMVLGLAAKKGYKEAEGEVRIENAASIALHNKLGYKIEKEFINQHGNKMYLFVKKL